MSEYRRSFSIKLFAQSLQKLVPEYRGKTTWRWAAPGSAPRQ